MRTDEQRDELERLGLLRLRGAVPRAAVEAMCDRLWDVLASEHGVRRDAPATWTVERPAGFGALERSGAFAAVGTRIVCDALDELLGRGAWRNTWRWGRPLVTFRRSPTWELPHRSWHLDFDAPARATTLPGVNLFTFLSPVAPRGGGTLVLAGSHRLVAELVAAAHPADVGRSREIRRRLGRSASWLRDLWSEGGPDRVRRFMDEGASVHGVDLRVLELTGDPGDVVVMHPWVFHAAAPNCRSEPRLMLVDFVTGSRRQRPPSLAAGLS